jgi:hypothetical protein
MHAREFNRAWQNLHVASRQPHSRVRLAGQALAGLVLAALLVVIAHNTVHLGAPRYSYFIEEWVSGSSTSEPPS